MICFTFGEQPITGVASRAIPERNDRPMSVRKPYRIACTLAALIYLSTWIGFAAATEAYSEPSWSPLWTLTAVLGVLLGVLTIALWFAPEAQPRNGEFARGVLDDSLPVTRPSQPPFVHDPIQETPPPQWWDSVMREAQGTLYYREPDPVAVGVAGVGPSPSATDTEVIPAVRDEGARPVAVAEQEADAQRQGDEERAPVEIVPFNEDELAGFGLAEQATWEAGIAEGERRERRRRQAEKDGEGGGQFGGQ